MNNKTDMEICGINIFMSQEKKFDIRASLKSGSRKISLSHTVDKKIVSHVDYYQGLQECVDWIVDEIEYERSIRSKKGDSSEKG